jgi:hypothetical protein
MSASGPSSSSASQKDSKVGASDQGAAIGSDNKGTAIATATGGATLFAEKGGVVTSPNSTAINLSGKGNYSPTSTTTTNITGLDPTSVLNAIGQLQQNVASSAGTPSTTVLTMPSAPAPALDLSGLGTSISDAINGALGTKASGGKPSVWVYVLGGLAILGLILFLRKRK